MVVCFLHVQEIRFIDGMPGQDAAAEHQERAVKPSNWMRAVSGPIFRPHRQVPMVARQPQHLGEVTALRPECLPIIAGDQDRSSHRCPGIFGEGAAEDGEAIALGRGLMGGNKQVSPSLGVFLMPGRSAVDCCAVPCVVAVDGLRARRQELLHFGPAAGFFTVVHHEEPVRGHTTGNQSGQGRSQGLVAAVVDHHGGQVSNGHVAFPTANGIVFFDAGAVAVISACS